MSHSSVWTTGPKMSPDCWTSSLGKSPKPMFCSSRLGLKTALDLRGLPVLFSLIISLPFWDALCCFKNSTQVSRLGNQVWILHYGDERLANGSASDAVYLSAAGMRSELHAISHIRHLQGVAPPVHAVSPRRHVSTQLTTHTSPRPWRTSDSSCLCWSLGPTAHEKIMKLITHIIYGRAPFADGQSVSKWIAVAYQYFNI